MIKTNFQRVSEMNVAFGNPKGDPFLLNVPKVRSQVKNILDEYCELQIALGADRASVNALRQAGQAVTYTTEAIDVDAVRDALCDGHVFAYGAHHMMGIDADKDMNAVIDGVMTRFIKSDADLDATIALHAARGVTQVYFEGNYPKMVMKSFIDQPDAPKDKFLKSASFCDTVFPPLEKALPHDFSTLEEMYVNAADDLYTKQRDLLNYSVELHVFIELRDALLSHPEFGSALPETYYSGTELDTGLNNENDFQSLRQ